MSDSSDYVCRLEAELEAKRVQEAQGELRLRRLEAKSMVCSSGVGCTERGGQDHRRPDW